MVRPDGSEHRVIAGEDPRATVFAGGWTGPGHYVCSIAPGDGPDADIVLVDAATGEHRTLARGGFLSVTSVSADERFVLARRGPRGYRHIVVIDVATGVQRRVLAARRPGGIASEDGRFGPDGRSVYVRAVAAGRAVRRPGRARRGPAVRGRRPRRGTRRPRPGRTPTWTATRCATDGTVLAVWTRRRRHRTAACTTCPTGPSVRRIALPEPVMPGWSLSADGATMVAELTGPKAPRGLWVVPLDRRRGPGAAAVRAAPSGPRGPRDAGPPRLRRPRRAAAVGLALPAAGRAGAEPHGRQLPRRTRGPGAARLVAGRAEPRGRRVHRLRAERARFRRLRARLHDLRTTAPPARRPSPTSVTTVAELVAAGIAAPGRIGAHGWSYGGYLTLVALTRWPDLFAAGVTLAGMSDLRTFFAGTEPWMAAASVTEYGDPVADRDLLAALSPMTDLGAADLAGAARARRPRHQRAGRRVGAGAPGTAGPRRDQRAAAAAGRGPHHRGPRSRRRTERRGSPPGSIAGCEPGPLRRLSRTPRRRGGRPRTAGCATTTRVVAPALQRLGIAGLTAAAERDGRRARTPAG